MNRLVVTLVITNIATYIAAKKIEKAYNEQKQSYKKVHDMLSYTVHLLDEHNVPLTEFDAIALNTIMEENSATKR